MPSVTTIRQFTSLAPLPPSINHHPITMVTSVHLLWALGRVARPFDETRVSLLSSDPRFAGWSSFTSLLSGLPFLFPQLRRLCLCLDGEWLPPQMAPNDLLRRFETDLLGPVDGMVGQMLGRGKGRGDGRPDGAFSSLCDVVVAIPMASCCLTGNEDECEGDDPTAVPVWRSLPRPRPREREEMEVVPAIYYDGEDRRQEGEGEEMGYWITHIVAAEDSHNARMMPELLRMLSRKWTAVKGR